MFDAFSFTIENDIYKSRDKLAFRKVTVYDLSRCYLFTATESFRRSHKEHPSMQQFQDLAEAQALALAVVDAIIDPFVVLDDQVRLVAASRSFYDTFRIKPASAHGECFYDLCGGDWNVPALKRLLASIIPQHTQVDGFELEVEFTGIGPRVLLLNARVVASRGEGEPTTLLVIKDITARRQIEAEKQRLLEESEDLLRQQRNLLSEMQHRVANSLQIIASILLLKAKEVVSQETRDHLRDAHQRVLSVAEVQAHLHSVAGIDQIEVRAYLRKLCEGLAASMTGPSHPIEIKVVVADGAISSSRAVSMGLIVTELVINAIKYAFPTIGAGDRIMVSYEATGHAWSLKVADNGVGNHDSAATQGGGLGTAIVTALAAQLGGQIITTSNIGGMTICLAGDNGGAALPLAA
jgi:two-component sensor histidine kinase/PAS domain-containing protein